MVVARDEFEDWSKIKRLDVNEFDKNWGDMEYKLENDIKKRMVDIDNRFGDIVDETA